MRLKGGEAAMRVRNQADAHTGVRKLAKHRGDIIVHLEMLTRRPLAVNLVRALVDTPAAAAHHLDDPAGIRDENRRVVDVVFAVEQLFLALRAPPELTRVAVAALFRAAPPTTFPAKRLA